MHEDQDIKTAVRERYAGHVTQGTSCCGPSGGAATLGSAKAAASTAGCGCGGAGAATTSSASEALGYDAADLAAIPEGADLGLGCGNPLAMLELKEGETVVDLGSGAGIDCFLAARRVGPAGRVIGVDMTPEMLDRARGNAADAGITNVEFRLGEIEHLPVADGTADAVISNCVVNLVPDKGAVFRDAFRVLAADGRLSVSDIVLLGPVPDAILTSVEAYVACLAGAAQLDDYLGAIERAGFTDVTVTKKQTFSVNDVLAEDLIAEFAKSTGASRAELEAAATSFASVAVSARKPKE